jgi:hypothetical protein
MGRAAAPTRSLDANPARNGQAPNEGTRQVHMRSTLPMPFVSQLFLTSFKQKSRRLQGFCTPG